jgi:sugar phosphate isomerase/epimerase
MNGNRLRTGTTSYIFPADLITNIRKLAGHIDDVELVLFELDDEDNLPSESVLGELGEIAKANSMSYTVHLPLSLDLGSPDVARREKSVLDALRIIRLTESLDPWAFVLHLNPIEQHGRIDKSGWIEWTDSCVRSLSAIESAIPEPQRVCIENLESFPIRMLSPIFDKTGMSLCLDIGHLWIQGEDPVPLITVYKEKIRVVHIHGILARDHSSLRHVGKQELDRVLDSLDTNNFGGVLTIEVFNEDDFVSSVKCIEKWNGGMSRKAGDRS